MLRACAVLLAVAGASVLFAPDARAAERSVAEELEATRLVYARAQQRAERPPRAPGRAGRVHVVPGSTAARGHGTLRRFTVEVEGGLRLDAFGAARAVERILASPRGWRAAGVAFRRVSGGRVDLRIVLASPPLTDRLCAPLATRRRYSCASGSVAVLNAARWAHGARSYGGNVWGYRTYMVNHEIGHLLGHGHVGCPARGAPAPVMMQQTKGVAPCRPNPWPLADELR